MSTEKPYFLMILFPFGPKPMVDDDNTSDPPVLFFATHKEAGDTAMQSRACIAYGAEIFRIGGGDRIRG